tara:strand:+ start:196 stop:378 length:183 start_codon:yes stop_codon:yes gene_type:complete
MKRIALPQLLALLLLIFGITLLNFEDLSLEPNWKAYTALLAGVVLLSYSLIIKKGTGGKN